jgi:hypothetical protein
LSSAFNFRQLPEGNRITLIELAFISSVFDVEY